MLNTDDRLLLTIYFSKEDKKEEHLMIYGNYRNQDKNQKEDYYMTPALELVMKTKCLNGVNI